jgi:hypothetical protein
MGSEDALRKLNILAAESRFSALSALDVQNILTAIELGGLGFGLGSKLTEHLNRLVNDK